MSASRKHQKNTSDSGPRTRSAVAEASLKKNFDIHDPIYKLPFGYGWKRELVYRKKNQKYKQGDVYYYSPNNKKLRSKKGVQEQLNSSLNENPLTIDNFTFIQQGIGLKDRTKEIIRDANVKVSKIVPATLKRQARQDPRGSRTAPGARPEGGRSGEDRQAYRRAPGAPGTDKKAEVGAGTAELDFRGPGAFGGFGRGRARGIGLNDRRKEIIRDAYAEVSKWNTVSLKNNGMVRDWEKCIKAICMRNSVVLDTRGMVTPSKPEEFKHFWETFALAIKNAKLLKGIELYRCSVSAVESVIHSLPQLTVLNATSLKNPTSSNNPRDLMVLNLNYLGEMVQLTELKLKGITGIKLTNLPSFEKLVNLKTLALTSIKAFPKDFNYSIDTVTKNLEFLEIGDVDSLQVEFAMILKRFTNLTSLRFENCIHGWNMIAKEVFSSIAGLKKLKILELINIDFNDNVVDGLQKLNNIKALLVIPIYISQSATTNSFLIDCLDKLSEKLTHFIWGITFDLLRDTDLYIAQFEKTQLAVDCDLDTLSKQRERFNNIPVLRNATLRWYLLDDPASLESIRETDNLDNVDLLQIPILKTVLQAMMERTKIEIVKVQVAAINQVYLTEHFDDV